VRTIELAVLRVRRDEPIEIDADVLQQLSRRQVVAQRRLDVQRPAVEREHAAVVVELVPLGVAAEVVVVVEDEDFRAAADLFDEVVRRREPAQSAADDDEIVRLAGADRAGEIPLPAIAQLVRDLERSVMAAAHAGARRWIVVRSALGRELLLERANELRREQRSDDAEADAVQEIATCDVAAHSKIAIVVVHRVTFSLWRAAARLTRSGRRPRA
jgi:hypothetical protein